jgi:hypothetical protein
MATVAIAAATFSIYLGNVALSRKIVALALVYLLCGAVYEFVILKFLYFQIHLRRSRVASDSLGLRNQVWEDIVLVERRVGLVLFVLGLMFVGSLFKGVIGIGISLLPALAVVVYARKLRIV